MDNLPFLLGVDVPALGVDMEGFLAGVLEWVDTWVYGVIACYFSLEIVRIGLRWFGAIDRN